MSENEVKLLPCPFCGGEAEVTLFVGNYGVGCTKCPGAIFNCRGQTKEEAIEAWNRRVSNETI